MRLDPATIANLARGAGFLGGDVVTMTALAVASSGGHTSYRWKAGPPGLGDRVGLWAIDADRYGPDDPLTLHDPHTAAQTAWRLTQAHGGFGWSDVYRAGTWVAHVPFVQAHTSDVLHRETVDVPLPHLRTLQLHGQWVDDARRIRTNLLHAPRLRR